MSAGGRFSRSQPLIQLGLAYPPPSKKREGLRARVP